MRSKLLALFLVAGLSGYAQAEETLSVEIRQALDTGVGSPVGTISISQTAYGALLTPDLTGLTPGLHGFHLHQNADCAPKEQEGKRVPALAAGGHYDPANTGRHEGPYGSGHLGDLPALYVGMDGKANYPVLAPRLKLADFKGHSLMIHAGGDNHADHPQKLGGGGARVACGVIR